MSWITELAKVYDNVINKNEDQPLPIYHITNNASVTITIDGNGQFIKAELIDPKSENKITCMPCTETCASRSSGADAYPLCDKLEYIYNDSEKYEKYSSLLKSWVESTYSNQKIKAVFLYISSKAIINDLRKSNIQEKDVSDFIRWRVEIPGDLEPALWLDSETQNSWIQFYNSNEFDEYCTKNLNKPDEIKKRVRKVDLDYSNGMKDKIAMYHPAKIRNGGDKAKIISSNDTTNYTFRGRFITDNEACQISSNTTQKAHSALRWLIKRQGVAIGDGLSIVTWNEAGNFIPRVIAGSNDLFESEKKSDEFDFGLDDFTTEKNELQTTYQTSTEFSKAINNRLKGYYGDITHPQNIMVMAIKEATPGQGRISIALYRELQNSEMIEALNNWYNNLCWFTTYWSKDKNANGKKYLVHSIGTPSPKTIAECAYGEHVKSNLVEKTVQRILPCILDGTVIPSDLEIQCVKAASNLMILESYRRDIVLETACAVYKYNQKLLRKEEYKLALEENRSSRDYLYGRLLAVEQQFENAALKKSGQEREPNAVRYMQQFAIHPAKTWLTLYKDKLPAYRRHLEPSLVAWFEKQIQDITALFQNDDYMNDKPLSGEFLLGYQCQLKSFRNNNNESEENKEE